MESVRVYLAIFVVVSICATVAADVAGRATTSDELPPLLRNFHQKTFHALGARTEGSQSRVKRQNGVIIDSIFQIPIQTLSAVNNLFKNSVLAIQNFNRRPEQSQNSASASSSALQYTSNNGAGSYSGGSYYNGGSSNNGFGSYSGSYYRPPRKYNYQSNAAIRGDLPVKNDGSSYRI